MILQYMFKGSKCFIARKCNYYFVTLAHYADAKLLVILSVVLSAKKMNHYLVQKSADTESYESIFIVKQMYVILLSPLDRLKKSFFTSSLCAVLIVINDTAFVS